MNIKWSYIRSTGVLFSFMMALALPAQAVLVTETQNFNADNVNASMDETQNTGPLSGGSDEMLNLSFDRFDNTAGGAYYGYQLNGVTISYNTDIRHGAGVKAQDDEFDVIECYGFFSNCVFFTFHDSASVEGSFNAEFALTLLDPATQQALLTDMAVLGCTNASGGAAECEDFYDSSVVGFSDSMDLSGFSLGDFVGTNPVDFLLKNSVNFTGSCQVLIASPSGNENECSIYNDALWSGSVTVEYSATEVPAPAALGLFGLALAGLGWSRRRNA